MIMKIRHNLHEHFFDNKLRTRVVLFDSTGRLHLHGLLFKLAGYENGANYEQRQS